VDGEVIYPHRHDLSHLNFYQCEPCDAYVGCHKSGGALGTLANAELRIWRKRAHAALDPLWQDRGLWTRNKTYSWLAEVMGIKKSGAHIAKFDIEQCQKVIEIVKQYHENLK